MSSILAFEASAESCSVSLSFSATEVKTLISHQPRSHAANLLPSCQALLDEAGVSLNSIDAIACATGPGSFTGLRIALSTAQGIAFANDKPLIPVNSLAALAISCEVGLSELVIPVIDARMGEIYWGVYRRDGSSVSIDSSALLGAASNFRDVLASYGDLKNQIAVGSNISSIEFANSALNDLGINVINGCIVDSGHVMQLARTYFNNGLYSNPRAVDLCYCRDSVAWNKRTRIRS